MTPGEMPVFEKAVILVEILRVKRKEMQFFSGKHDILAILSEY
jgi:hypothetical protein